MDRRKKQAVKAEVLDVSDEEVRPDTTKSLTCVIILFCVTVSVQCMVGSTGQLGHRIGHAGHVSSQVDMVTHGLCMFMFDRMVELR